MNWKSPDVRRHRRAAIGAVLLAASLVVGACGATGPSSGTTGPSSGPTDIAVATASPDSTPKLIVFLLSFPCGLNNYATNLCEGATAAGEALPDGYELEIKTGIDYGDTAAYNSLIQNSLQLKPAGLIVFPNGPAAQVPVLKEACTQGVKVIIIDSPANDPTCQSTFVGANHHQLGVDLGNWLIAHPASSKEVGIVSLPPGQYTSNDARVRGFTETVSANGYQIVATAITDLSLDKTRTEVTNMITAHPNLGVILSANDQMGNGTAQAVTDPKITQLSIDGALDSVARIPDGGLSADAAQDPYAMGSLAVESMVKAIQGQTLQPEVFTQSVIVDAENVEAYIAAGGPPR